MAKFTVLRTVDAYVTYTAKVEAETAKQAAKQAYDNEDNYKWAEDDVSTFDARSFVTLDENGGEIPGTYQGDL